MFSDITLKADEVGGGFTVIKNELSESLPAAITRTTKEINTLLSEFEKVAKSELQLGETTASTERKKAITEQVTQAFVGLNAQMQANLTLGATMRPQEERQITALKKISDARLEEANSLKFNSELRAIEVENLVRFSCKSLKKWKQ